MKKFYLFLVLAITFACTSLKAQSGKSLVLNGTDQCMIIPHHEDFNIKPDESFTVSAYVKMKRFKFAQRFISKRLKGITPKDDGGYELWSGSHSGNFYATNVAKKEGGNVISAWSNQSGSLDTWVHIGLVIDRQANTVHIYQNGEAKKSGGTLGQWAVTTLGDVVLGAGMEGADKALAYFFQGELDNVRFWKRALTADEMKADMTAETPATDGLVAAYDFENINGLSVPDVSGSANVHNGTLKGFKAPVETQEYKIFILPTAEAGTVTIEGYTGEYKKGEVDGAAYVSAELEKGKEYTLNVVANEGYELTAVNGWDGDALVDNKVVTGDTPILGGALFTKKIETKVITIPAVDNGTLALDGVNSGDKVAVGTEVAITATPKDGYELESITVGGKDVTAAKKFTVGDDNTIVVKFRKKVETKVITIPVVDNGTLALDGVNSGDKVAVGTEVAITATPKDGYELESITVGGKDVTAAKKFTVGDDNTIVVKFKKITAIAGLEGISYQVYPNPATDYVQLNGFAPNTEVRLIALTGKTVLSTKTGIDGRAMLHVSDLARGLYLVRSGKIVVKLQVR